MSADRMERARAGKRAKQADRMRQAELQRKRDLRAAVATYTRLSGRYLALNDVSSPQAVDLANQVHAARAEVRRLKGRR